MSTREHYEKMFADSPDLVQVKDFRVMPGGVTEKTSLKTPEPGKRRRPGTGCLHQINDHLWEDK